MVASPLKLVGTSSGFSSGTLLSQAGRNTLKVVPSPSLLLILMTTLCPRTIETAAKPEASAGKFGGKERVKNKAEHFRTHARTRISDFQQDVHRNKIRSLNRFVSIYFASKP